MVSSWNLGGVNFHHGCSSLWLSDSLQENAARNWVGSRSPYRRLIQISTEMSNIDILVTVHLNIFIY